MQISLLVLGVPKKVLSFEKSTNSIMRAIMNFLIYVDNDPKIFKCDEMFVFVIQVSILFL